MKKITPISYTTILFLMFSLTLIIFEFLAAKAAYINIGWMTSGIYFFLMMFNVISFVLFFFNKKKIALILSVAIALYIIPEQIILTNRLLHLKEESANIVSHIYRHKLINNDFPTDIDDYEYRYPNLKQYIRYKKHNNDFQLLYYVGSTSTHYFIQHSEPKYWYYVDD